MSAAIMLGRVAKMEDAGRGGVVVAWRYFGETPEQALARWRVEHPDEDPDKAGQKVVLVSWLDPQPGEP
jgi:hypothetical protein